jgi:hypothetical protein
MKSYLVAAVLLTSSPIIALAQSSTATSGTIAPMTTAPAAGNGAMPAGQNKVVIPPAARSGEKGLRVGNDAVGDPIEVRRNK